MVKLLPVFLFVIQNGILSQSVILNKVSSCPKSRESFEKKELIANCTSGLFFHCGLLINDTLIEYCSEIKAFKARKCPVYNPEDPDLLVERECKVPRCPKQIYKSTDLYKYPVCWEVFISKNSASTKITLKTPNSVPKYFQQPSTTDRIGNASYWTTAMNTRSTRRDKSGDDIYYEYIAALYFQILGIVGAVLIFNIIAILTCKKIIDRCKRVRDENGGSTTGLELQHMPVNVYDDIDHVLSHILEPIEVSRPIEDNENEYHHLNHRK